MLRQRVGRGTPGCLVATAVLAAVALPAGSTDVPLETTVPAPAEVGEIRAEVLRRVESGELPSLAIAVLHEGDVVWQEVFGWADVERRRPATRRTAYGLASLGKSVTATALMRLVERGALDLDRPVAPYLAPAALHSPYGYAGEVTARHILQMTASIPHGEYDYLDRRDAAGLTLDRMVDQRGLVAFPPGEVHTYSNFAYGVLERLIEKVSGRPYETFLRDELFRPLGMRDAFVAGTNTPSRGARRYGRSGQRIETAHVRPRSSLALNAGLDDLVAYARLHGGWHADPEKRLLRPETLQAMHTQRGAPDNALMALGMGSVELDDGGLWLLTNGRAGGVQSTLTLLPERQLAVIVLTNRTGNATDDLAFRTVGAYVPGFLAELERRMAEYLAWAERPYAPTPDLQGVWNGSVVSAEGPLEIRLEFQPDGDIHVRLGNDPTLLADVAWREGLLSGRFLGELPLDEAAGHPHRIDVNLRHAGARLEGYATAVFANERGSFALAAPLRLSRVSPER